MSQYIDFEQIPFGAESFAENPDPRCPCVLLLDVSGSMAGAPIHQLNEGIKLFKEELTSDSLATKRVEIAMVSFGGSVTVENDFTTATHFYPSNLSTSGATPMGEAIRQGIAMVNQRKKTIRDNGVGIYRPWIILITDGAPTDSVDGIAQIIREGEESKRFCFFAIGVNNANMEFLRAISVREPLKLQGLMFKEFFVWLSGSLSSVSNSIPGTAVPLLPPSSWAAGWESI